MYLSESLRKEQTGKLSAENNTYLSLPPGKEKKNLVNMKKYMKRGTSNDSIKFATKNILITSDITISSVD